LSTILNQERWAQWTRQAVRNHTNLLIYDFSGNVPDKATITAMGAELKTRGK
jgi:hypothetical protein